MRGGLWGGRGAALVPLERRQKEARDPSRGRGEDSARTLLRMAGPTSHQGSLAVARATIYTPCQQLRRVHRQDTASFFLALLGAWLAHPQDLICFSTTPVKKVPLEVNEEAAPKPDPYLTVLRKLKESQIERRTRREL